MAPAWLGHGSACGGIHFTAALVDRPRPGPSARALWYVCAPHLGGTATGHVHPRHRDNQTPSAAWRRGCRGLPLIPACSGPQNAKPAAGRCALPCPLPTGWIPCCDEMIISLRAGCPRESGAAQLAPVPSCQSRCPPPLSQCCCCFAAAPAADGWPELARVNQAPAVVEIRPQPGGRSLRGPDHAAVGIQIQTPVGNHMQSMMRLAVEIWHQWDQPDESDGALRSLLLMKARPGRAACQARGAGATRASAASYSESAVVSHGCPPRNGGAETCWLPNR